MRKLQDRVPAGPKDQLGRLQQPEAAQPRVGSEREDEDGRHDDQCHGNAEWQAGALLAGSLLIAAPDGMEIVNLTAALALLVALAPQAIHLIRNTSPITPGATVSRCRDCRNRSAATATR